MEVHEPSTPKTLRHQHHNIADNSLDKIASDLHKVGACSLPLLYKSARFPRKRTSDFSRRQWGGDIWLTTMVEFDQREGAIERSLGPLNEGERHLMARPGTNGGSGRPASVPNSCYGFYLMQHLLCHSEAIVKQGFEQKEGAHYSNRWLWEKCTPKRHYSMLNEVISRSSNGALSKGFDFE